MYFLISILLFVVSNGMDLREFFGYNMGSNDGDTTILDVIFDDVNNYSSYIITVNGNEWLYSGEISIHHNNEWQKLTLNNVTNNTGSDNFGIYNELILYYMDKYNAPFIASFKIYPLISNIIVFKQAFPNGLNNCKTHIDGVISSFPSFNIISPKNSDIQLGYIHYGGHFDGYMKPQFGRWENNITNLEWLNGGLIETSPLVIFNKDITNSIVISALTDHMAYNDNITYINNKEYKQMRWGIQGGVNIIDTGYSIEFIIVGSNGGVNGGMKEWGNKQLLYHGKLNENVWERDYTLQWLGYSTDHGTYYYYYTETGKNYQDTILDIKAYHDNVGLPTKYLLLDSWWYYKGRFDGVTNWTAMPNIFPNGNKYIFEQTGWKIQAHNRYWAVDTVYANNNKDNGGYNGKIYDALSLG